MLQLELNYSSRNWRGECVMPIFCMRLTWRQIGYFDYGRLS